jgi:hypothetical protein
MRLPIRRSQYGWYLFGFTFVRPEWELAFMKGCGAQGRKFTIGGWLVFRRHR